MSPHAPPAACQYRFIHCLVLVRDYYCWKVKFKCTYISTHFKECCKHFNFCNQKLCTAVLYLVISECLLPVQGDPQNTLHFLNILPFQLVIIIAYRTRWNVSFFLIWDSFKHVEYMYWSIVYITDLKYDWIIILKIYIFGLFNMYMLFLLSQYCIKNMRILPQKTIFFFGGGGYFK